MKKTVKRMENTDIQVNDWIYLSEKGRYPMRVKGISESGCLLDFEGNEGDPFDGIYSEGGIAPIELTAEIVKDNGFGQDTIGSGLIRHIEGAENRFVLVNFRHNGECRNIEIDNGLYKLSRPVRYVHELQHALRLAGLNDMADNLKIE